MITFLCETVICYTCINSSYFQTNYNAYFKQDRIFKYGCIYLLYKVPYLYLILTNNASYRDE